jgi:hypothetical protein
VGNNRAAIPWKLKRENPRDHSFAIAMQESQPKEKRDKNLSKSSHPRPILASEHDGGYYGASREGGPSCFDLRKKGVSPFLPSFLPVCISLHKFGIFLLFE